MTKDYKNVSESKNAVIDRQTKSQGKPTSKWILASGIFVIGGFVAFLVYLNSEAPLTEPDTATFIEKPVSAKKTEIQQDPRKPEEERFKFYDILPNREVNVPLEEVVEPIEQQPQQPKTVVKSKPITKPNSQISVYELQAGSFLRFKDADKRKASLAFLGIQAKIHAVKAHENKTLYRVRIGPYDSISKINQIEHVLEQNKIKSLLIKIRG